MIKGDTTAAQTFTHMMMNLDTTFNTDRHLNHATRAGYEVLSEAFNKETDSMALVNRSEFMHVYDWGTDNDPLAGTGNAASRLFRVKMEGRGGNRTISWDWLPSYREVPINPDDYPEDFDTGRLNHNHVFSWKAPVMEYGQGVHVKQKSSRFLVIPFPETYDSLGFGETHTDGNREVLVTRDPYDFNPGMRAGVVGNFTAWFTAWWSEGRAATILEEVITPARNNAFRRSFTKRLASLPQTGMSSKTASFAISTKAAADGEKMAGLLSADVEQEYLRIAKSKGGMF